MFNKLAIATGLATIAILSTVSAAKATTDDVVLNGLEPLTKLDYFGASESGEITFNLDGFFLPNNVRSEGDGPANVVGKIKLTDAARADINAEAGFSGTLGLDDVESFELTWTGGGKFIPESFTQTDKTPGVNFNTFAFDFSKIPQPTPGTKFSFVLPLQISTRFGPEQVGTAEDGSPIFFSEGFDINLINPPSKAYQRTLIDNADENLEDLIQDSPNTITYNVTVTDIPEPSQVAGIAGLVLLGGGVSLKKKLAASRRTSKIKSLVESK